MSGPAPLLRRRPAPPGLVVAVLATTGMCSSFMQTIVLPIQSELPGLLGASRSDTAWVVTVTLLGAAIGTPVAGRLGDMYGKRKATLALLGLLVIGSVIAALAPGLEQLLVGRALQGTVVGIIPLGIAMLRDVVPPSRLPTGVALLSSTLGVGGAIGFPASALVTEFLDWHMIFWCSAGVGILCGALILAVVPPSPIRTGGRFDAVGALWFGLGLAGVLIAISRAPIWGWLAPPTLGLAAAGLLVLAGWAAFELRIRDPIVDLRVAARPRVLFTNIATIAMGFALFSSNIVFPQLLELPPNAGLGLPLLTSALVLVPSGLIMIAMAPIAGRLARRYGPKLLLVIGAAFLGLAYLLSYVLDLDAWGVLLVNVVIGIGIGLGYGAMPALIMQSVPRTKTAAANGLNSLMRSIGTSTGSAVMGAVLAASATAVVDGVPIPSREGFDAAYLIGAGASGLAVALALVIPRRRPEDAVDAAIDDLPED